MYYTISSCIGALIAIMVFINGILSSHLGNYLSTIIIHLVGLLFVIVMLFMKKATVSFHKKVPLFLYSAGAIGIFTVLFSNYSFIHLGVSLTLALGLLGQTITSILSDTYGWFGLPKVSFQKKKLIGLLLLFLGICIMIIW